MSDYIGRVITISSFFLFTQPNEVEKSKLLSSDPFSNPSRGDVEVKVGINRALKCTQVWNHHPDALREAPFANFGPT